ncbi:MAG: carboxypeptidase regulatory-like domain-containing protein [Acidobacteriota bacterium]|nr:MAG: carboxypeptidase regulatory-like domain-containing protein [Acidobacteriota bacterium]
MRKTAVMFGILLIAAAVFAASGVSFEFLSTKAKAAAEFETAAALPDQKDLPEVKYTAVSSGVGVAESMFGGAAVAGASADFDSDGVKDVVTVDTTGRMRLFRGNADTIYPNHPEAVARRAERGEPMPFEPTDVEVLLPTVPDLLFSGDLNGDGFTDIIAVTTGLDRLNLVFGGGYGAFSQPVSIPVGGRITAMDVGEIGRNDKVADLAVAYQNKEGSFVAIFEHREGAFRRAPERFRIAAPANAIAIGKLDADPYGDVAVASGSLLTIIHGRGNPYPLDMSTDIKIERPKAVFQSRQINFQISDLVAGNFGESYGEGLVLLGTDGRLVHMQPRRETVEPSRRMTQEERSKTETPQFLPIDVDAETYRVAKESSGITPENAVEFSQSMIDYGKYDGNPEELIEQQRRDYLDKLNAMEPSARSRYLSEKADQTRRQEARRKELFEAMLAARPIPIASFTSEMIAQPGGLASSAAAAARSKLVRGRFSSSNSDDIAVIGSSNEIFIAGKFRRDVDGLQAGFGTVALESGGPVSQVIPMRLNADGLNDLVILGAGTAAPRVATSEGTVVLVVNTTDDQTSGDCLGGPEPCGLRRAIQQANFFGGNVREIRFNIPGNGPFKFEPATNYPSLLRPVIIDGTTQPGFAGTPIIEIDGTNISGSAEGIRVQSSNTVIRGLVINNMPAVNYNGSLIGGSGIVVLSTNLRPNIQNVTIEGNYLGTNVDGTARRPNWGNGVQIFDAYLNTVGGTVAAARNLLSGNGDTSQSNSAGVGLAITAGHENKIFGNYIGTDTAGNVKVRNETGVFLAGIQNEFGGDGFGEGNVVSGNGGEPNQFNQCGGGGMWLTALFRDSNGELVSYDNLIRGNLIGTRASGLSGLGNCHVGISTIGNINTEIGSSAASGRNTIADNGLDGLYCGFSEYSFELFSGFCFIGGNNIGTNATGTSAIPNDWRNQPGGFVMITGVVWLTPSQNDFAIFGAPGGTTPNGACTGFCNLLSGNASQSASPGGALHKTGGGTVLVHNNVVGLNKNGTTELPNNIGIVTRFNTTVVGGPLFDGQNFIDGGNTVSGNRLNAIVPQAETPGSFTTVRGNRVGSSTDGLSGIGNGVGGTGSTGINAFSAPTATVIVGGTTPFSRNYVVDQKSDLISMGSRGTGIGVSTFGRSEVVGNWVGLNVQGLPLGNSGVGINASGNGDTRIGGTGVGEGNVIKNNGRAGVTVVNFANVSQGATKPERIQIRGNTIAFNGELGIDLMNALPGNNYPNGVTPNDCDDIDTGANDLQNFPELFTPVPNQDGTLRIDTILRSNPSRNFTIDYYLNTQGDPTNHGEGESYLGSINVMTNGNGFVSAAFNTPIQLAPTALITATATDQNGNTSEFSCIAGVCHQSANFAEALERSELGLQCIEPIVVNVEGNEDDLDGDLPIQQRDGLCDVDLDTPGEQCTLRAAIQEANARPGFDQINFDIPGGGIRTITIPNAGPLLPDVKGDVDINAISQPGWSGSPMVQLVGEVINQTAPARGVTIAGNDAIVRGLSISRFAINIDIANASGTANNNRVENCYIGVNADGTFDPNTPSVIGVALVGNPQTVRDNKIGSVFNGNVIGNNSSGIVIAGSNARFNQVLGNKIGTNQAGTSAIPNEVGVVVGSGARENTVGAELYNGGNLISGNIGHGIAISSNATLNKVTGNLIGTAQNGMDRLANGFQGIWITGGANNNTVGGANDFRNIISGNNGSEQPETASEIFIDINSNNNKVVGNFIGLKLSWNADFGVPFGVTISSSGNTIGGEVNAQNDFGVSQSAVIITATGSNNAMNNTISYNRIGTYSVGQSAGNANAGITLQGNTSGTNITHNQISGNAAAGILIHQGASGSNISNNKIGTTNDGNGDIPNGVGILMTGSSGNSILANVISGNRFANVYLGDDFSSNFAAVGNAVRAIDAFFPDVKRREGANYTLANIIQNNRIGTNTAGTQGLNNGGVGVQIGENARENQIGGSRSGNQGNIISGHLNQDRTPFGVYIGSIFDEPGDDRLPRDNYVQGNTIGLGVNGLFIGNGVGIKVAGGVNNLIGAEQGCVPKNNCDPYDLSNVIGGSLNEGVILESQGTSDTQINGNLVGVKEDGSAAGNGSTGVKLSSVGYTEATGNIVGNNNGDGFVVEDPIKVMPRRTELLGVNVKITGNFIGVFKRFEGQNVVTAINQGSGLLINNVPNVLVGAFSSDEAKNVIAANRDHGIKILGPDSQNNIVNHSVIGTDEDSTLNIGNGEDGINIESAGNNTIGDPGGDPDRAPTVGGNQRNGIALINNSVFNTVQGALVGVNRLFKSTLAVPNQQNGVRIENSSNNRIGNALLPIRNFIGANQRNGVLLNGVGAQLNQIFNNSIGGSGLGNQLHGVHVTGGANNNAIGGEQANQSNQIFENGGNGILIDEFEEGQRSKAGRREGTQQSVRNSIGQNEISGNLLLGIDIGEPGRTDNDPEDADEGPNRGQNYPELENLRIDEFDRVLVEARVDSHPDNQNYGMKGIRIDFYKSDLVGQGSEYLATYFWTEGDFFGDNFVEYDLGDANEIGITLLDKITAVATDADGNSSEFFPVEFGPTSAGVSVSGRVMTADGRPVQQVTIEIADTDGNVRRVLTNSFGYFVIEGVAAGRNYVLSAKSRRYRFSPADILLSVTDPIENADFTAVE